MDKIDFKKTLDSYQAKRGTYRMLAVPDMRYLAIDGHGDPNTSPDFSDAIAALYPIAFALKFLSKRQLDRDYVVPPLEGLWSAADMDAFAGTLDKSQWDWTLMLMVPDWIDAAMVEAATVKADMRPGPVRLQTLHEGLVAQTLHVGSFDDEGPVIARMHQEFIPSQGLRPEGLHHEIYLSDFRRTAPEKLRTIIRQPVAAMSAESEG